MATLQFAAFGQDDNRLGGTDIGQVLLTTVDGDLCSRPLVGHEKGLDVHERDLAAPHEAFLLNVRWAMPEFGYLWLQADNGGQLYRIPRAGSAQVWNLNYELARSRVLWNSQLEQAQGRLGATMIPAALRERLNRAGSLLHDAMFANHDRRSHLADDALAQAMDAGERLAVEAARWRIAHEAEPERERPFATIGSLGQLADAGAAAHAAWTDVYDRGVVDFAAEEVDSAGGPHADCALAAAAAVGLTTPLGVRGRALLPHLDDRGQPRIPADDAELAALRDAAVRLAVRYRSRIGTWELLPDAPGLNLEPAMIPLALETARAVKAACPDARIVLRVGEIFPWRMALPPEDPAVRLALPKPLETIRECLHRGGAAIDALAVPLGYPGCDLLQLLRTIDLLAKVGLPLELTAAAAPSQWTDDSRASLARGERDFTRSLGYWRQPWSPDVQADYGLGVVLLARAHPMVRAIEWADFSDSVPHAFPFGGLLNADGQPKPLHGHLAALRRNDYRLASPWPLGE
ncbi:MAG: hypothetical protein JXL80_11540 [Planctomycetes bacterium]|nr:hypothetical protein [Planctomycetota bacterium]